MREILQQEAMIAELKQSIQNLKTKMKERSKQLPKGYCRTYEEKGHCKDYDNVGGSGLDIDSPSYAHSNTYVFGGNFVDQHHQGHESNENNVQLEENNMYARMKHHPRPRYKIRSIRTPFASYGRRRLKK